MSQEDGNRILIVDDEPFVLESLSLLLSMNKYAVITCENATDALVRLRTMKVDVVVTDIKMPQISGLELLEKIRSFNTEIPVILMTAFAELEMAIEAIKNDVFDFIIKPYKPENLLHSVQKAVKHANLLQLEKNYKLVLENTVKEKTQELANALITITNVSKEIIHRLAAAAEFKDSETGAHILRMGLYSQKVAQCINMPEDFVESITFASLMHDIGKIGIPDKILLKPGHFTHEEFEIMKTHTTIGDKILSGSSHAMIQMSASIAHNHHERWDGTGYPRGLRGENIPIEARIVMLCDQYDALRSARPYKPSLNHQEVVAIITKGDNRTRPEHFCPLILKTFTEVATSFDEIYRIVDDKKSFKFENPSETV